MVERGYMLLPVALGEGDERRVGYAEGEIEVLLHQLGYALPFRLEDRFDDEFAGGDGAREGKLGVRADAVAEQVGNLRHH